jgi:Ca2+-binding EF-hand superfamily protein
MDTDKDGVISAGDLEKAFASVGKSISGGDASNMLSEAPGPVNFTQLVTLFAEKMAGGEIKIQNKGGKVSALLKTNIERR